MDLENQTSTPRRTLSGTNRNSFRGSIDLMDGSLKTYDCGLEPIGEGQLIGNNQHSHFMTDVRLDESRAWGRPRTSVYGNATGGSSGKTWKRFSVIAFLFVLCVVVAAVVAGIPNGGSNPSAESAAPVKVSKEENDAHLAVGAVEAKLEEELEEVQKEEKDVLEEEEHAEIPEQKDLLDEEEAVLEEEEAAIKEEEAVWKEIEVAETTEKLDLEEKEVALIEKEEGNLSNQANLLEEEANAETPDEAETLQAEVEQLQKDDTDLQKQEAIIINEENAMGAEEGGGARK